MTRKLARSAVLAVAVPIAIGIGCFVNEALESNRQSRRHEAAASALATHWSRTSTCVVDSLSAKAKEYLAKSALEVGLQPGGINFYTASSTLSPLWEECANRLAIPRHMQGNSTVGLPRVYALLASDPEYQTTYTIWKAVRTQELAEYDRRAAESAKRDREGRAWLYRDDGQIASTVAPSEMAAPPETPSPVGSALERPTAAKGVQEDGER